MDFQLLTVGGIIAIVAGAYSALLRMGVPIDKAVVAVFNTLFTRNGMASEEKRRSEGTDETPQWATGLINQVNHTQTDLLTKMNEHLEKVADIIERHTIIEEGFQREVRDGFREIKESLRALERK